MGDFKAAMDDVTAVTVEPIEAADEPAPASVPASEPKGEPKPAAVSAPLEGEDRSANYAETLAELEGLLPEDKRHLLRNRSEQGVRWSRDALAAQQEIKTLTERFGNIQKIADELAETFTDGKEYLEKHGPAAFLKAAMQYRDTPPEERQEAPVDSALSKRLEALEAHIAGEKKNQEERAAERQLAADLSPLVQETLKGFGIQGEKTAEAAKAIGHLARLQYFGNAYRMPAGTSTPARAVQEVAQILDLIADARKPAAPKRATPREITPAKGPDNPRGAKGYKDMQDTMFGDVSKDIEEAAKVLVRK